ENHCDDPHDAPTQSGQRDRDRPRDGRYEEKSRRRTGQKRPGVDAIADQTLGEPDHDPDDETGERREGPMRERNPEARAAATEQQIEMTPASRDLESR